MPYHIDYETWSEADIKKVGGYRYANDPSTRILMFAIAGEDGEVACWDHLDPDSLESRRALGMFNHAIKTNDLLYAHNAPFEVAITHYRAQGDLGLVELPKLDQWRCTMAMCRRAAIPSSLAAAGEMLGLSIQKDKAGANLMEIFSIPGKTTLQAPEHVKVFDKSSKGRRAPNKHTLNPLHGWYDAEGDHPEVLWDWLVRAGQEVMTVRDAWDAYKDYCRQDVLTEMALHKRLHKFELTGQELRSFQFNLRLNYRGVPLNLRALRTAQQIVDQYSAREELRFKNVTGLRPSQGQAFKKWLQERGYPFDNLQAGTVEQALNDFDDLMSTDAVKALEAFSMLNFAALKKISAMLRTACSDGMVRGTLKWHGARTGRATGELVQPQNIKKATLDTTTAYQMLCDGCTLADLEELWESPLEVVASCARHFIQREGTEFFDADFVGVEARLTPWIAGEQMKLDKILAGVDLYKDLATRIFGISYDEVTKKQRTIAKPAELGCCIAEGQMVLVRNRQLGEQYVPIQQVLPDDELWDGAEWVSHDGLKYNGWQSVLTYEGVTATEDHQVFVEGGGDETVSIREAASRRLLLQASANPEEKNPEDLTLSRMSHVYDILNAGPRNRFTVNGKLVHNCFGVGGTGLQKGLGAAPYFVHMSRKECNHIVKVYRDTHPNTVAAWKALEDAAKLAIIEGTTSTILNGRVRVGRQKIAGLVYMILELPSKRRLYYPHVQVKPTWKPYTKEEMQEEPWKAEKGGYWLDQIRFWGERPNNAGWGWIATWGSRLFENCLTGDTEVLTEDGWLPITEVGERRVFDGQQFVAHSGLRVSESLCVIRLDGLGVTPEHLVLTNSGWTEAQNVKPQDAYDHYNQTYCRKTLEYQRHYRTHCRKSNSSESRTTTPGRESPMALQVRLRGDLHPKNFGTDKTCSDKPWAVQLEMSPGSISPRDTRNELHANLRSISVDVCPVQLPQSSSMAQLWWKGHHGLRTLARKFRELLRGYGINISGRPDARSPQQHGPLHTRELPMDNVETSDEQQEGQHPSGHPLRESDFGTNLRQDRGRAINDLLPMECRSSRLEAIDVPTRHPQLVYDLLNCGPRNRFVVRAPGGRPLIVHNCVQAMGADLLDQGCQAAEARGFEVFLIVHDQALCYAHPTLTVKDFEEAFCSVGEWADSFPLAAEAQVVPYYRKD